MSCDSGVRKGRERLRAAGIPENQARALWGTRYLKVAESNDPYAIRGGAASRPMLRLQGAWLGTAGFSAGSRVTVEVRERELTIRPEGDPPAPAPRLTGAGG